MLLDEIQVQRRAEVPAYTAIIESTVSRTRPVLMAATTTILGMVPPIVRRGFRWYGGYYYLWIDVCNVADSVRHSGTLFTVLSSKKEIDYEEIIYPFYSIVV